MRCCKYEVRMKLVSARRKLSLAYFPWDRTKFGQPTLENLKPWIRDFEDRSPYTLKIRENGVTERLGKSYVIRAEIVDLETTERVAYWRSPVL